MTFRVGQRVVCIEGPKLPNYDGLPQPAIGCVYTIRGITPREVHPTFGKGVWLEEIVSPISEDDGHECGFFSCRFRPIVAREASIEIFTRMLTPAPQKESAQ